ncbi:MAG: hypothetical protein LBG11_03985 [Bifidobacteriaceae bacterium]|jgi:hypothetical protein|nr:hypothetical protein [Bifidobacteriaceae bacterium]
MTRAATLKTAIVMAFRTLFGPWMALGLLGIDIGVLLMRGAGWLGESMSLVRTMAVVFNVAGALLAGVAATDAARISRAGNIDLVLAVRKTQRRYLWAWLWTFLPAALAHVIVFLVAALAGGDWSPRSGWGRLLLALAVQLADIGWFIALGSVIGRLLPAVAAALVAAVTGLVAVYFFQGLYLNLGDSRFSPLGDSGSVLSQIGLVYNPVELVLQLACLGVSSAVFLWSPVRSYGARSVIRPVGLLTLSAVIAALLLVPSAVPSDPFRPNPTPPDVCVGGEPKICYYHEHERYSTPYIEAVQRASATARDKGYEALVPETVVETSMTFFPSGPDQAGLSGFEPAAPNEDAIVSQLLSPEHCPQMYADVQPSEVFWLDLGLLEATWVELLGHEYQWFDNLGEEAAGLVPLSPDEVAAKMAKLRACDFE